MKRHESVAVRKVSAKPYTDSRMGNTVMQCGTNPQTRSIARTKLSLDHSGSLRSINNWLLYACSRCRWTGC